MTPQPDTTPPEPALDNLIQRISLPLYQSGGWSKFLGVLLIITGVLMAITVVGIPISWIPIWMGVLLIRGASAAKKAQKTGQESELIRATSNIKTFFILAGAFTLMELALLLLVAVAFITMQWLGITIFSGQCFNFCINF